MAGGTGSLVSLLAKGEGCVSGSPLSEASPSSVARDPPSFQTQALSYFLRYLMALRMDSEKMRNSPPMAGVWRIMGEVPLETVTAVLCLEPCSLVWHKQSPLTGPAVAQVEVPGIGSELRQTVQPGVLYSTHLVDFRSRCSWRNSGRQLITPCPKQPGT